MENSEPCVGCRKSNPDVSRIETPENFMADKLGVEQVRAVILPKAEKANSSLSPVSALQSEAPPYLSSPSQTMYLSDVKAGGPLGAATLGSIGVTTATALSPSRVRHFPADVITTLEATEIGASSVDDLIVVLSILRSQPRKLANAVAVLLTTPELTSRLRNVVNADAIANVVATVLPVITDPEFDRFIQAVTGEEDERGSDRKWWEKPRDPLLDIWWWIGIGWWWQIVQGILWWIDLFKRWTKERKAGWDKPFNHDWSCKEKCNYWKEKADWIVNKKHGGSKQKLETNERDLKDCLECCDDNRMCQLREMRRGSDEFFTWLTGIP